MRYRLRTLLIVLALGPMVVAAGWFTSRIAWSDELLLFVAVACAIPYWTGLIVLLAMNHRRAIAWLIAVAAGIVWLPLFFMSFMQLVFVVPLWAVFLSNGTDLGKSLSPRTVCVALGLTAALFVWITSLVLTHG